MGGWSGGGKQVVRKGYTLVELSVVVGVLVIMVMVGMPIFTNMLQNSRVNGATQEIAGYIREARSRATLSGWQYRIFGGNGGGSATHQNRYRLEGTSTGVWPASTSPDFNFPTPPAGATQMASPWINPTQDYPGVILNPTLTFADFYVSFNAQGARSAVIGFDLAVTRSGASRTVSVTPAGGVTITNP